MLHLCGLKKQTTTGLRHITIIDAGQGNAVIDGLVVYLPVTAAHQESD